MIITDRIQSPVIKPALYLPALEPYSNIVLNQCWWTAQHTCTDKLPRLPLLQCVCVCVCSPPRISSTACERAGLWQNQIRPDTLTLTHCPSFLCSKSFNPHWRYTLLDVAPGRPVEEQRSKQPGGQVWLPFIPPHWRLILLKIHGHTAMVFSPVKQGWRKGTAITKRIWPGC